MIDKLFYIIYNKYYKHGDYKNDIPPLTVAGLFVIAVMSLIMLTWLAGKVTIDPTAYAEHRLKLPRGIFLIAIGITFFSFYYNSRYKAIYERYKNEAHLDSTRARVIAFIIIFLAILSPMIFSVLWIRLHEGIWLTIGPW